MKSLHFNKYYLHIILEYFPYLNIYYVFMLYDITLYLNIYGIKIYSVADMNSLF